MSSISVCIVAADEREELSECLEGLQWAGEIIVVAATTEDAVQRIAARFTDRVFRADNRLNPNENKNYALSLAGGDWVLLLDPDERVTGELREEILGAVGTAGGETGGYLLSRKNYYFGRWLRRGGFYPDRQLRLFRRGRGGFACRHIHERLTVQGEVLRLNSPLLHYTYRSLGHYFRKLDFKAEFEARYLESLGVRPGIPSALRWTFVVPLWRFLRRYLLKGAFLDG